MFDEPIDAAQSEDLPVPEEQAGRSARTRLAVGALVLAAALGGLGAGVAWAADDDAEDPVPTEDPTDDRRGCGRKGSTDTSLL